MEWHFVIPAVSVFVVTAVVATTGLMHSAPDAGQYNRFPAVFLIPGLLAAALAWFGERLIESWMSGSHGFDPLSIEGLYAFWPERHTVGWSRIFCSNGHWHVCTYYVGRNQQKARREISCF
jgi:hypothetical protein